MKPTLLPFLCSLLLLLTGCLAPAASALKEQANNNNGQGGSSFSCVGQSAPQGCWDLEVTELTANIHCAMDNCSDDPYMPYPNCALYAMGNYSDDGIGNVEWKIDLPFLAGKKFFGTVNGAGEFETVHEFDATSSFDGSFNGNQDEFTGGLIWDPGNGCYATVKLKGTFKN